MKKLRLQRVAAGRYVIGAFSVYSVLTADRRKEWRVEWHGDFVSQCGSLDLARKAVLAHEKKIDAGEVHSPKTRAALAALEDATPNGRGGKREGAGRKPIAPEKRRKPYTCRLSPETIAYLRSRENATETLEQAVRNSKAFRDWQRQPNP